jgi:hypothetical protein
MIRVPDWLNPWRRIAQLELELENAQLRWEVEGLNLALRQSNSWYDRVRATNVELRAALELYRDNDTAQQGERIEYVPPSD